MTEYSTHAVVGLVLVNNFVLVKFLGLCPFARVSKSWRLVASGLATTFVLTLTSVSAYLVETYILTLWVVLNTCRTMSFIFGYRGDHSITEIVVHKTSLSLSPIGIFLPLITTNCAVLGVRFEHQ